MPAGVAGRGGLPPSTAACRRNRNRPPALLPSLHLACYLDLPCGRAFPPRRRAVWRCARKAAAFDDPRGGRGTWWDWKPAKLVLEDLLDQGLLMCTARTPGFARLYDLTERVLPPGLDTSEPSRTEASRHLLLRGLRALGVATANEMADYYRLKPGEGLKAGLAALRAESDVVEVDV